MPRLTSARCRAKRCFALAKPDILRCQCNYRQTTLMKYFLIIAAAVCLASCSSTNDAYRVEKDSIGRKTLVGRITRSVLEQDSSFSWFSSGVKNYMTYGMS